MAAIAWQMGYKTGTDEAILAGGNKAFNAIPSAHAIATLARTSASLHAGPTHARGIGQGGPHASVLLDDFAKTRWKQADNQATKETSDKATAGTAWCQGRRAVHRRDGAQGPARALQAGGARQIGTELDAGREVVVGQ